jgi:hypothetical protein
VDEVADLELRRPEELAIGLGGEELGDPPMLVLGGLMKGLNVPLGFGDLFGCQVGSRGAHGEPSVEIEGGVSSVPSTHTVVRKIPPTFETLTRRSPRPPRRTCGGDG